MSINSTLNNLKQIYILAQLVHTYGMFGLFLSLSLLGLAAVDPIGIAVMPLLLSQKHPLTRSFIFLFGSFIALISMGLVFSRGLGEIILRLETTYTWLVPAVETAAGFILLAIAFYLFRQTRTKEYSGQPSQFIVRRLQLGSWQLFIVGALIVTVQSIVDVVFVVAMVQVGTLHLPTLVQFAGITTYAIAALLLQLAIIVAYLLTPIKRRTALFSTIHSLVTRHAYRIVIVISILLGGGLLLNGVLAVTK
jgi:hypothetical protein